MQLILASQSKSRKMLLNRINCEPDIIINTDIDETPKKQEKPKDLALRLALEKAMAALSQLKNTKNAIIISGDTVVSVGRRTLDKALTDKDVENNMKLLSGRNNRVYSGFCVLKTNNKGEIIFKRNKVEEARVRFKALSKYDIKCMVASKDGIGVAGGYTINGFASAFIIKIIGTSANIIGLPIYQLRNALLSAGFKIKPKQIPLSHTQLQQDTSNNIPDEEPGSGCTIENCGTEESTDPVIGSHLFEETHDHNQSNLANDPDHAINELSIESHIESIGTIDD